MANRLKAYGPTPLGSVATLAKQWSRGPTAPAAMVAKRWSDANPGRPTRGDAAPKSYGPSAKQAFLDSLEAGDAKD